MRNLTSQLYKTSYFLFVIYIYTRIFITEHKMDYFLRKCISVHLKSYQINHRNIYVSISFVFTHMYIKVEFRNK